MNLETLLRGNILASYQEAENSTDLAVINALPVPVLVLGQNGQTRLANPALNLAVKNGLSLDQIKNALHEPTEFGNSTVIPWDSLCTSQLKEYQTKVVFGVNGTSRHFDLVASAVQSGTGTLIAVTLLETTETLKYKSMAEGLNMEIAGLHSSITNIVHDLRNPLTVIKGNCELLRKFMAGGMTDLLLDRLGRAEGNVSAIVNSILELKSSRSHTPQELNALAYFESLINSDSTADLLNTAGVKLKYKRPLKNKGGIILADPDNLAILHNNLVGNAIHAMETTKDKVLKICLPSDAQMITYFVQDNGIGISPENQRKLFVDKRFSTKRGTPQNGTGMGLNISKEIAIKNGGDLSLVWSRTGRNSGTLFAASFPLLVQK